METFKLNKNRQAEKQDEESFRREEKKIKIIRFFIASDSSEISFLTSHSLHFSSLLLDEKVFK